MPAAGDSPNGRPFCTCICLLLSACEEIYQKNFLHDMTGTEMQMKKGIRLIVCLCTMLVLLSEAAPALAYPQIIYHGDREKKRIAITMDDCWKNKYVQEMLDLCALYKFHMTFFPAGKSIEESEREDWRRIISDGHEIGNHTNNHVSLTKKTSRNAVMTELRGMEKRLKLVLGFEYQPTLIRPPYGRINDEGRRTARWLENYGYPKIIMWSVSETDPDVMLKKVQNGDILLYHSNKKDVEGLRKAIPILLERGYELVTVSELLGLEPPQAQTAP
jgi:peptidoglycan/xylan/chitin deacetylase (PgdA/CDA1 family)